MSKPARDERTGSKNLYNEFCKRHPSSKLTYKDYRTILIHYNSLIANHILETGQKVKLPWGLGELCINKYKRSVYKITQAGEKVYNYKIDFKKTKEYGKTIYHTNLHTQGYNYHWFWTPTSSRIKYAQIWSLTMIRDHSRGLVRRLKEPGSKYKNLYREFVRRRRTRR